MAHDLQESIAHWEQLAEQLEARIRDNYSVSPIVDQRKADTYRRTAKALRLEQETGQAHCVCCLKPRVK